MKRQAERLAPANLAQAAIAGVGELGRLAGEFLDEYRAGAAVKEAEIRASLDADT